MTKEKKNCAYNMCNIRNHTIIIVNRFTIVFQFFLFTSVARKNSFIFQWNATLMWLAMNDQLQSHRTNFFHFFFFFVTFQWTTHSTFFIYRSHCWGVSVRFFFVSCPSCKWLVSKQFIFNGYHYEKQIANKCAADGD